MPETEHELRPVAMVNRTEANVLEIEWPGGKRQRLSHQTLRAHCRCAECKAGAGNGVTDIARVGLVELRPVGAYGVQLLFSDGHNRGIYPWSYLCGLRDDR